MHHRTFSSQIIHWGRKMLDGSILTLCGKMDVMNHLTLEAVEVTCPNCLQMLAE